jgi:hypothetical protein
VRTLDEALETLLSPDTTKSELLDARDEIRRIFYSHEQLRRDAAAEALETAAKDARENIYGNLSHEDLMTRAAAIRRGE